MSDSQLPRVISELPTGWFWQSLGNCLKVRNGFAFKSSDYQQSGVLLIRQSNLGGNRVSLEKAEYLPEAFLKEHKDFRVKKGDVLIGMSGSIGKLCVYDKDEPALQNQRTGLLQFKNDSLRSWIWHYLPLLANKLHEGGKGVGVQNISASQIEALPIPIAPKEHRARIVEEIEKQFSRLDEAVANLKRVKANLKRYKAAVLKAAVEGKLTEDWRREHPDVEPASKLLERILAERRAKWNGKGNYRDPAKPGTANLPALPNSWIWTAFEQISLRVTVGHVGPMKHEYVPNGVPFLRSQNVRENKFDSEGLLFIRPEFHSKLSKSVIQSGDLAVVRSGSVGVTCVIPDTLGEANCADLVLIQGPLGLVPQFGAYYMNSMAKRHIEAGKVGIALTHFNTRSVAAMPVPLPPLAEQELIVSEVERRLSVIEELETTVETNLTRAERFRQAILCNAFDGTLPLSEDHAIA